MSGARRATIASIGSVRAQRTEARLFAAEGANVVIAGTLTGDTEAVPGAIRAGDGALRPSRVRLDTVHPGYMPIPEGPYREPRVPVCVQLLCTQGFQDDNQKSVAVQQTRDVRVCPL
jgi:hypothetical protein